MHFFAFFNQNRHFWHYISIFLRENLQISKIFCNFVCDSCESAGMKEMIRHKGIVEQVRNGQAVVLIGQTSACAGCHAAKMCMASEHKEKRIEAVLLDNVSVGDEVEVQVREELGWLAVLLAYVVPFLLLVAAVAGFNRLGWTEGQAGTAALASVAIYYLALRLFRDKLQRKFTFEARPLR